MGNLYIFIDYIAKNMPPDMERITSLKDCSLEILSMNPKLLEVMK